MKARAKVEASIYVAVPDLQSEAQADIQACLESVAYDNVSSKSSCYLMVLLSYFLKPFDARLEHKVQYEGKHEASYESE